MPLLARQITGPLWARAAGPGDWQKPNFPYQLLSDLVDRGGGGVSFWEVKSAVDPALKRIAAALLAGTSAAPGKDIKSIEFRFVDKLKVQALGIPIKQIPGDTRDTAINGLHCELDGLNSQTAIALLRLMNKRARLFNATETARFITESIVRKHLNPDVLKKDFLYALHQKNAVRIVMC